MPSQAVFLAYLAVLGAACNANVGGSMDPAQVDAAPSGADPSPDYVRYRGTLASTPATTFGGAPYCNYSVVLRDVVLEVVMRKTEALAAMAIEDTMTESIVGTCPYTAEMPSRQQFTHDSRRPVPVANDGKAEPVLSGIASNRPMTAATGVVTVGRDGLLQATARWERSDQGPPLKWIISTSAPVALQRTSCTPGSFVCVGDALYACVDGMKMSAATLCPSGCNAAKTACN